MTHMRNSRALQDLLGKHCNFPQAVDIAKAADNGREFCVYLPPKSVLVEVQNLPSGMIISLKQNVSREVLERGDHETFTCRYILWVME